MRLSADQYSDSLGKSSLKLLVELINTDSVYEVSDIFVVFLAFENNSDIEGNENVVIGWASANRELVDDVLLGDEELDLGPREAGNQTALLSDMVELAMLSDYCVSSLRPVS